MKKLLLLLSIYKASSYPLCGLSDKLSSGLRKSLESRDTFRHAPQPKPSRISKKQMQLLQLQAESPKNDITAVSPSSVWLPK
jgi:hypothetical protein